MSQERIAFENWLGIKPCGAAHDLAWAAWQARASLPAPQQATPEPLPEHADHVSDIAARLRLVAKLAGVAQVIPDDDRIAVGAIFSVLGNMRRALERKQATPEPNPWREAVEDELTILHASMPTDPREAVKKLVALECQIALDPDVSQQAAALVQRGRDEAAPEPVGEPAEWQARVNGNKHDDAWRKVTPTKAEPTVSQRVEYLRSVKRADGQPAYEFRALYPRPAPAAQAVPMTDEPQWIVNDLGELGVRVGSRFFFLYKGDNIEYGKDGVGDSREGIALHNDGTPMRYRIVGKREFGETCRPLKWVIRGYSESRYTETLVFTPGLSWGDPEDADWKPLPAHGITTQAKEVQS